MARMSRRVGGGGKASGERSAGREGRLRSREGGSGIPPPGWLRWLHRPPGGKEKQAGLPRPVWPPRSLSTTVRSWLAATQSLCEEERGGINRHAVVPAVVNVDVGRDFGAVDTGSDGVVGAIEGAVDHRGGVDLDDGVTVLADERVEPERGEAGKGELDCSRRPGRCRFARPPSCR